MSGTLPRPDVTVRSTPTRASDGLPVRGAAAVRPWSALVCGLPEDRTLLIVDWLLLACRSAGYVAHAVPIAGGDASTPHGMYVEVAADGDVETQLGATPWGAVDLVVAGEHLELVRAIDAGYVSPDVTTIVASVRRAFTPAERRVAPQFVLSEREIDALATASSLAYHAFDGPEVARWYDLPAGAQPGLLFGAICGTGVTGLDADACRAAITQLGIDGQLHSTAFGRGIRMGRRTGGRVRRARTAYQFTRRRRALVAHASRLPFEALIARAETIVTAAQLPALQEAIYLLCEFQDAEWATQLVDRVEDIVRREQLALEGATEPAESLVPAAIRSLAALMVWPDAAWVASRKRRNGRHKALRAAHSITRRDAYELIEFLPLDATDLAATRSSRRRGSTEPQQPPLLQPVQVRQVRATTVRGALELRRLAASSRHRAGSARQERELKTLEAWLDALHAALAADHSVAAIVAASGTLVQGAGAVREANRQTAQAFWGRIVRQSLALDRADAAGGAPIARHLVPFVWEQLCRSGPLALWEYAAQVLGISLAASRGLSHAEAVQLARALCTPKRPISGS